MPPPGARATDIGYLPVETFAARLTLFCMGALECTSAVVKYLRIADVVGNGALPPATRQREGANFHDA